VKDYEEFVSLLQDLYPQYHMEMMIRYVDKEGDRIAVTCQMEWEEMIAELSEEKVFKLYIEEGLNPKGYFKDGPDPEPLHFYNDTTTKEPVEDNNFEEFKFGVPKCLERLFRDNKIIPSNIPSFLKDAIRVEYKNQEEVDLDIDIPLLIDLLHRKALDNLKSSQKEVVEKGRDFLIALMELNPEDYIALYNLACAESLLQNVPEAIKYLEMAITAGYRDMEHILSDTDFDNIKRTDPDGFMSLIAKIKTLGPGSFFDEDECENCTEGNCSDCREDNYQCENDCNDEKNCPNCLSDEPVVLEYDSSLIDDEIVDNFGIYSNIQNNQTSESNGNNLTDSFLDLRTKWTDVIKNIKGLGFDIDDEVLSLLLEQSNGNVDDVINLLLQTSKPNV